MGMVGRRQFLDLAAARSACALPGLVTNVAFLRAQLEQA